MSIVRPEQTGDQGPVRNLNELAFGRPNEADLVDALRLRGAIAFSLVAVDKGAVVGHILFTPVSVESGAASFSAVALGPMAVLPDYQRTSIGSELMQLGLQSCRKAGHDIVVVLGHPTYYPRFGFVPARPLGITCEFDVPDEVFMVAELRPNALKGRSGVVKYQPEFNTV